MRWRCINNLEAIMPRKKKSVEQPEASTATAVMEQERPPEIVEDFLPSMEDELGELTDQPDTVCFGLENAEYQAQVHGNVTNAPIKASGIAVDEQTVVTFELAVAPRHLQHSPYFNCAFINMVDHGADLGGAQVTLEEGGEQTFSGAIMESVAVAAPGDSTVINAINKLYTVEILAITREGDVEDEWERLSASQLTLVGIVPDSNKQSLRPMAKAAIRCAGLPFDVAGRRWHTSKFLLRFVRKSEAQVNAEFIAEAKLENPAQAVLDDYAAPEPEVNDDRTINGEAMFTDRSFEGQARHDTECRTFWKAMREYHATLCEFAGVDDVTEEESKQRFDDKIPDYGYFDLRRSGSLATPNGFRVRAQEDENPVDRYNLLGLALVLQDMGYGFADGEEGEVDG